MWQISEILVMFDTQFGFSVCHPLRIINVQYNVKIIADHNLIRYLPERSYKVCIHVIKPLIHWIPIFHCPCARM